jgi:hypothetical protein
MHYYVKEEPIILKEYGKIIQKFIMHAMQEGDREKRTKVAYAIVEYMAQLSPAVKSTEDYRKKLWDHLFFITDYQLDVDAPYDIAQRDFIVPVPESLPYPSGQNKFRHYGRYIVEFIEQAKYKSEEQRRVIAGPIASYMKLVHKTWNNEVVNDAIVKNDLYNISTGMLEMADDESIRHLLPKGKMTMNHNPNKNSNNKKKKKKKGNGHHNQGNRPNNNYQNKK